MTTPEHLASPGPQSPDPGTAPPERSGPDALAAEQDQPWLRLETRMLLVHPVDEVVKLLPPLTMSSDELALGLNILTGAVTAVCREQEKLT